MKKWKAKVTGVMQMKSLAEEHNLDESQKTVENEIADERKGDVEMERRFCFESSADRKLRKQRQGDLLCKMKEIDINNIVDKDEDDVTAAVETMVMNVLDSVYFKGIIFSVIFINAIHIALQTVDSISIPYSHVFYIIDNIIMGIFISEIILKWYCGFVIFWKDYWNILDFSVILVLHLGSWMSFFSNTRLLRILRIIRAFRSLKTVTSLTGLSIVVETILQSIPDMANIMVLLFIFMIVLSVVGVKLFGKFVPEYFGDPLKCMFSIFVCFTQDGWMQIFQNFEKYREEDPFTYASACIFFIITILIAAFIIANLMIAVVTTNLDKAMQEMKAEQQTSKNDLSTHSFDAQSQNSNDNDDAETFLSRDPASNTVSILHVNEVLRKANTHHDPAYGNQVKLLSQRPLYKCDLTNLTTEKLENYLFLLFTLEENLSKYRSIRKELGEVLKTVKTLNEHTGDDTTAKMLFGRDSEERVSSSNVLGNSNVTRPNSQAQ